MSQRLHNLTSPGGRLTATIADGGAELSSLTIDGRELLYRANQFEPTADGGWQGRAPWLWPAVGRNYAPAADSCSYEHDGRRYPMPIHGFAMNRRWSLLWQQAGGALYGLAEDEETMAGYPWPFQLRIGYTLDDGGLTARVEVTSPTGLPFCLGNHLTLAVPEPFDAVRVSLPAGVRHGLTRRGLLEGTSPIDLSTASLADELFLNGVVGGLPEPAVLTAVLPDGLTIRVGQAIERGAEWTSAESRLFVFYGSRERGYWCPEPWLGWPNGLQARRGVVELPAAEVFVWTMRIDLEQD